jgi:hypothetical protein
MCNWWYIKLANCLEERATYFATDKSYCSSTVHYACFYDQPNVVLAHATSPATICSVYTIALTAVNCPLHIPHISMCEKFVFHGHLELVWFVSSASCAYRVPLVGREERWKAWGKRTTMNWKFYE